MKKKFMICIIVPDIQEIGDKEQDEKKATQNVQPPVRYQNASVPKASRKRLLNSSLVKLKFCVP